MNTHVKQNQTTLQLDYVSESKGKNSPSSGKLTSKMKASALFREFLALKLHEGMYGNQIIEKYKLSKSKVYYHIKVMRKAGIIFLENETYPHLYKVSPNIIAKIHAAPKQKTLDDFSPAREEVLKQFIGYDRLMEINTHHIKIRLDVLKGQLPIPANSDKEYEMKGGWKRCIKYVRVKGYDICVMLNYTSTPNVIVQVPQIYGSSILENNTRAMQIAEEVRLQFMRNTAFLELGEPRQAGKMHWNVEDPILDYLSDKEQLQVEIDSPNGKVFACKTPVGERESDDVLTAQDYVRMPVYVQQLSKEFSELKTELKNQQTSTQFEGRISDLEKGMNKLMDLVEKMMSYSQGQQQFITTQQPSGGEPPVEMFG